MDPGLSKRARTPRIVDFIARRIGFDLGQSFDNLRPTIRRWGGGAARYSARDSRADFRRVDLTTFEYLWLGRGVRERLFRHDRIAGLLLKFYVESF